MFKKLLSVKQYLVAFGIIVLAIISLMLINHDTYAAEEIASGTWGANLTWVLDDEGTLSISGSGDMENFPLNSDVAWKSLKSSIRTVQLGENVTSIGNYAFFSCENLTSIYLPDSLCTIGNAAFFGCTNLKKVYINDLANYMSISLGDSLCPTKYGADLYIKNELATEIVIPDGIDSIGSWAFNNCKSIKRVIIPDGVTSIGESAFFGCSYLTTVAIPHSVTSIGGSAFEDCTSLRNITIENGVTSIGYYAFRGCTGIGRITLPDSITSIQSGAFERCSNLKDITLSNSLANIPNDAFKDCSSLESIIIPDGVTYIGNDAFYGCSSLTSIFIPNSIQSITAYKIGLGYIAPGYKLFILPDSPTTGIPYKNRYYLYNDSIIVEDYLGFNTDRIIIEPNGTISLSDFLVTNLDIKTCDIVLSNEEAFFTDKETIVALKDGNGTLTVSYGDLIATVELIATYDSVEATGITLNQTDVVLEKGKKLLLSFSLSPENTTDHNVIWSSQNSSIVSVDNNGFINAKKPGTTMITAKLSSNSNITANCEVTVISPLKAIITLEEVAPYSIQTGTTKKLQYFLYPYDATDVNLSFTSSNPDIISIDNAGNMTAHADGNVQITITSGDIIKIVNVESFTYIPLIGLTIDKNTVQTSCGDQIQLTPIYEPENTTEREVAWSSDKEEVATIDGNGLVTVHGRGIATISISSVGLSSNCIIICNAHSWGEGEITTAPTCTEDGVKTYTCSCGETNTEVVPATSHIWNFVDITFTEKEGGGYTAVANYVCENNADHTQIVDTEVTMSTTDASCTEAATTTYKATVTAEASLDEEEHTNSKTITGEALGHEWGEWTVTTAATCTTAGEKIRTCSRCGHTETREVEELGHTEETLPAVEATCTSAGLTEGKKCTVCGEILTAQEVIPALGHDLSHHDAQAATCTEIGWHSYDTCSRCDFTTYEVIPAKGHSWEFKDLIFTEAEDGGYAATANYVCKNDAEHKENVAAMVTVAETDANCTEAGTTTYTATVTEEASLDGEEHTNTKTVTGEALGHDFGEWTAIKEATCTTAGEEKRTCSRCGHIETREVEELGHTEENLPAVAATCTETGLTEGWMCTVCGEILTAQEIIPALGHEWDYENIKWQWTETDDGYNVTATLTCLHDSDHTETVEAEVTGPDNNVYTATFNGPDGKTYSDTFNPNPVPDYYDERISGTDRYATATEAAKRYKDITGTPFKNVVVACGTNFPDALAGGYLADVKDAPILLVTNWNEGSIANYIKENMDPDGTVYLLGGTGVVSSSFENKIKDESLNVERLGGADRYETNIRILKEAGVTDEEILVCTGTGYADSLSASAVGLPILLVGDSINGQQRDYLKSIESNKFYLIGGPGAVKESVRTSLQSMSPYYSIERIYGQTRYETSTEVAKWFFPKTDNVLLAYAQNFPDGLSGGPLAMKIKAPILLVDSNNTGAASAYVKRSGASGSITLGGPTLISDAAINRILGK